MKKAILTIGLFTLVLVSTSFASPKDLTSSITDIPVITSIDETGSQSSGENRKVDDNTRSSKTQIVEIDGTGGQAPGGGGKKID